MGHNSIPLQLLRAISVGELPVGLFITMELNHKVWRALASLQIALQ